MAVTYAWRLDSDKFAYIVPPENLSGDAISNIYGYLSKQPLSGNSLKKVADTAQERFGRDGGKAEYLTAFTKMEEKIRKACSNEGYRQAGELIKWDSDLEYADMLSADMYYSVDAQNCADLRGVGIKGTMYLGSLPNPEDGGIEPTNVSYYASGARVNNITILPGLPGYTDIYGIYLTDQIENENDAVEAATSAPEYMFVVRNGKDGAQGERGEKGESGANGEDVTELIQTVTELSGSVATLSGSVTSLETAVEAFDSDTWKSIISRLNTFDEKLAEIERRLTAIEGNGVGGGGGGSTGGGSITIKPLLETNNNVKSTPYYILVSKDTSGDMDVVYAIDYAKANKYGIAIGDNIQISSGGILQSQDKIYAGNGFYQATTNIENLPE